LCTILAFSWAEQDPRIAGFLPWHWQTIPNCCMVNPPRDQGWGAVTMPQVVAELQGMGRRVIARQKGGYELPAPHTSLRDVRRPPADVPIKTDEPRGHGGPGDGPARIDVGTVVATTDPRFLSFNIDTTEFTGVAAGTGKPPLGQLSCPCADTSLCRSLAPIPRPATEVVAFTAREMYDDYPTTGPRAGTQYKSWDWRKITAVSPFQPEPDELYCTAHKNGAKMLAWMTYGHGKPGPTANCSIFGQYFDPTQYYGWMLDKNFEMLFNQTAVLEWASQSAKCVVASGYDGIMLDQVRVCGGHNIGFCPWGNGARKMIVWPLARPGGHPVRPGHQREPPQGRNLCDLRAPRGPVQRALAARTDLLGRGSGQLLRFRRD
jgi:hypothetical protein